ncbi:MAG: hypothetical protein KDA31_10580 [Phycisphaerales bacterium]|nr:hypothetical protein [Phycisphaerales bacterium]MCB9835395.1 hypothetical protein [Phycisphaera sp.]
MSVKSLSVLLLAGLAAPTLAQSFGDEEDVGIQIAPEREIRFFATGNADFYSTAQSRGRFGGELTSASLDAAITAAIPVDEQTDATLTFSQTSTGYDFDNFNDFGGGRTDPIDYGLRVGFSGTIRHSIDPQWSLFGGANIDSSGEIGADIGDSITFGGFFGIMHHVHEDLSLGLAIGGFSQLEDDFSFFPIPTIQWQIDDYWNFVAGATPTNGKPGVEIAYHLNDAWQVGGSATFDFKQFRLKDDNSDLPDGVFRDWSIPLMFITTWSPEPRFSISGRIGAVVYREVSLRDTNEVGRGSTILNPSFGFGVSGEYRF